MLYKPASEVEPPIDTQARRLMFASLVQGPLLRLFSVGLVVLALQRTLFADLRPAGVSLQVMLALAAAAGAAGGPQKGALAGFVLGLMYDLAVGTPLGSSSIAMGLGGFVAGYVHVDHRSTRSGGWRRCSPALGAAVGEAAVPVIRAFIGEEHVFEPAPRHRRRGRRGRRPWCSARCSSRRPLVHAHQAAGVEGSRGSMMRSTRAAASATPRTARLSPMAADKRAARLGVLALVATLLFGAVGARLWFLQTVQAESLQQTVDARKTKTVRLLPERGRIFDADGRILADNERVLTVSRRLGRDPPATPTGPSCSPACRAGSSVPGRRDGGALRLRAATAATCRCRSRRTSTETVAIAISERIEDFPGVSIVDGLAAGLPVRPAGQPRRRLHGRDHRRGPSSTTRTSATTRRSAASASGAAGVELSMETVLHGKWGEVVYEVDANNRIVREISYEAPVNGWTSSCRSTSTSAVRRAAAADPARACGASSRPPTRRSTQARRHGRGADGPEPRRRHRRSHYKAPAGSVTCMDHADRADHGDGQLPDVRQPLVQRRRRRREVRRALPDRVRRTPIDPDDAVLTNRAIQGQYNMGSTFKPFTAYAALATGLLGPDTTYNDQGTYKLRRRSRPTSCARGVRCEFRNSTCPHRQRPVQVRRRSTSTTRSPCRATRSSTSSARSSTSRRARSCRTSVRLFGFGSDTGIDLPFEFDGRVPTNELKAQLVDDGVLGQDETPNLQPGDLLQLAIGQGLLAATPLQLAVGYAAIANGGIVLTPHVVQAILAPETPDGDPASPTWRRPRSSSRSTPPEPADPDAGRGCASRSSTGLRQNVTGPGVERPLARPPRSCSHDYPADAIPIAGKTGTAQGPAATRGTTRRRSPPSASIRARPYTVVSYLEKAGLRLDGRGAGRQVHVPGPVGHDAHSTRSSISEPLDTRPATSRPSRCPNVDAGVHGTAPTQRHRCDRPTD